MKTSLLVRRRLLGGGFSPSVLFAGGEPGVWYDPSDLTTMFQDRAGTTLVTTPGQSVGLVLDKRLGLTPGPELVTNGGFDTDVSGWTGINATLSHSSGSCVITADGAGQARASQTFSTVVGRWYEARATLARGTGAAAVDLLIAGVASSAAVSSTTPTDVVVRFAATGVVTTIRAGSVGTAVAGTTYIVDNISVREIPGNHMVATADASRGTYGVEPFGGRRNLLTFTEQFENAAWSKVGTTVSGNTFTATSTSTNIFQSASFNAGLTNSYTLEAKAGTSAFCSIRSFSGSTASGESYFNVSTGVVSLQASGHVATITPTSDGFFRCTVTATHASAPTFFAFRFSDASGSTAVSIGNTMQFRFPQLELGSTATPYQRVTTAFDVTETGVPTVHYVQFDGADDGYLTSTITPGTDKVQVFAGVRKLSDAALGIIVEHSATIGANNGVFNMFAPRAVQPGYSFGSKGTTTQEVNIPTGYVAPTTNILTGIGDISGDVVRFRINGAQVGENLADQGTGNYLAYPLYIGRRGGAFVPFNGRLYQMVVRFGPNLDAARIAQVERFINSKTGAY